MTTSQEDLNFSGITRIAGGKEDFAADVTQVLSLNCLTVKPVSVSSTAVFGAVNAVSNAAVPLRAGVADLSNRCKLVLCNAGTMDVFIGGSTVTKNTGFPLKPGITLTLEVGPMTTIYGIVSSSAQSVRIIECSI